MFLDLTYHSTVRSRAAFFLLHAHALAGRRSLRQSSTPILPQVRPIAPIQSCLSTSFRFWKNPEKDLGSVISTSSLLLMKGRCRWVVWRRNACIRVHVVNFHHGPLRTTSHIHSPAFIDASNTSADSGYNQRDGDTVRCSFSLKKNC